MMDYEMYHHAWEDLSKEQQEQAMNPFKNKNMKEKIEQYLKNKETLTAELKEWVKDKSIPLENRWELFHKSELGDHNCFYEAFIGVDSDCYYDDFYLDRHASITTKDLYYKALEIHLTSEEAQILFKEDVLNKFVKSFENDW